MSKIPDQIKVLWSKLGVNDLESCAEPPGFWDKAPELTWVKGSIVLACQSIILHCQYDTSLEPPRVRGVYMQHYRSCHCKDCMNAADKLFNNLGVK
jgi:hypothetical protein